MKNDDTWKYALREVSRRKQRTIGNVSGYSFAVAVLLILASWINYAQDSFIERLSDIGAHLIAFQSSEEYCCPSTNDDATEGFIVAETNTALFAADLVEDINRIPYVLEASAYISYRFKDPIQGFNFTVGGLDLTKPIAYGATVASPKNIVSGRFLTNNDSGSVLLHHLYADSKGLQVGSRINIAGNDFEVIGIVKPPLRPTKPDVLMHIKDASLLVSQYIEIPFSHENLVNVVLVEAKDAPSFPKAVVEIEKLGFTAFGYGCNVPAASAMGMNKKSTNLLMILIALTALIFSGKTQHASVVERQHDIGILKAIGWSNLRIMKQIIIESTIQAFIGGVIGIIIAAISLYFLPLKAISGIDVGMNIVLSWVLVLIAIPLSIAGGIMSSIIPAWSSAKKNPADALRYQ